MMTLSPASAGERALASFCSLFSLASFMCLPLFFPRLVSIASIRHTQRPGVMSLQPLRSKQGLPRSQDHLAAYKYPHKHTRLYSPPPPPPAPPHHLSPRPLP